MSDKIQILKAKASGRQVIKINPSTSSMVTVTTGQNLIKFNLPNSANLAGNVAFGFNVSNIAISGSTNPRLVSPAWGAIARVVIKVGSVVVTDINEYGLLQSIYSWYDNPDYWRASVGAVQCGILPEATRNGAVAGTKRYVVPLLCDLFEQILPTKHLNQPVVIEIYMQQANRALEADSGTLSAHTYTVSDMEIVADYVDDVQDLKMEGGFPFRLVRHQQDTLNSGVSSASVQINDKVSSLTHIVTALTRADEETDSNSNNKFDNYYYSTMNSYQYKVNGKNYPDQPIDCTNGASEALNEALSYFDNEWYDAHRGQSSGPAFNGLYYTADASDETYDQGPKFVMCQSFSNLFQDNDRRDQFVIGSGVRTASQSSSMQLILSKTAEAAAYNIHSWTTSDAVLLIDAAGNVSIQN